MLAPDWELTSRETILKARLIVFKDPVSGKILKFVSNMLEYKSSTIIQLYKYRWSIEVLFKQIKQNFELNYFYSDSPEGIKTQIWIVLIANLIFTVIHRQVKECEQFITIVSMASNNLGSYCSLVKLLKRGTPQGSNRNIEIMQFDVFNKNERGGFEIIGKSP